MSSKGRLPPSSLMKRINLISKYMKPIFLYFFSLLALLAVSCGSSHNEEKEGHGHGHEHGEVSLALQAYGPLYELYAEADPMAAGDEGHVMVHLTRLSDFKPLEKATVSLRMTSGGKEARIEGGEMVKPGLWKFEVTPAAAGEGRLTVNVSSPEGDEVLEISGVEVFDDDHKAIHEAEEHKPHHPNGAVFTKAMSWNIDFATTEARLRPFGEVIRTVGRIEPSQGDVKNVVAKTSGVVSFAAKSLVEGAAVRQGETLFTIDATGLPDNSLELKVHEAERRLSLARQEYERLEKLAADKLVGASELAAAKTEYENAKEQYSHLNRNFGTGRGVAVAPIGGYLSEIFVRDGQYVEAGQSLATVARNRNLYVRLEVPVRQARSLEGVESASIRPMNSDMVYELNDLDGGVVSVGQGVAGESSLVPLTLRIANKAVFIPGEFVEVWLRGRGGDERVVVPFGSLVEEMGRYFVYVQITPEYFEKRLVEPGRNDGQDVEILKGLRSGERVVSRGAVMVKLSQAAGALDAHAGHVH